jgi:VCBS repeat-containing protein
LCAFILCAFTQLYFVPLAGLAASSEQIQPTAPMVVAREGHTATVLQDGRVLIAGGSNLNGVLASAEIYDPQTRAFTAVGGMNTGRVGHTATLLRNGKVLIAGGTSATGPLNSAEIFQPTGQGGSFEATGLMTTARSGHTATLRTDGIVMITGGDEAGTAEFYDPGPKRFTAVVNPMIEPRWGHTATLFDDNSLLLAGGGNSSAELFDEEAQTFSLLTNHLSVARAGHFAIPTFDDMLLLFGGDEAGTVDRYNPFSDTFSLAATLGTTNLTATLLANERILVLSPALAGEYRAADDRLDPLENATTLQRRGHTASALEADKRVLVAGGLSLSNDWLATAAVFNPASLATDKDDYPPGATAYITGEGFAPNERVELIVTHISETNYPGNVREKWEVQADADGNFLTTWHVCEDYCLDSTLRLRAEGDDSGLKTEVRFTDANLTWTGNTSIDWGTGSNWSSGNVPNSGDNAIIPTAPTGGRFPTITATHTINALTIQTGATLTMSNGTLTVNNDLIMNASASRFNMVGGTLNMASDWRNNGGIFNGTGGTVVFTASAGAGATFAAGTNQFYNIQINTSVNPKFDNDANSNIRVAGNWVNNSTAVTLNNNTTTVLFNGTGAQTIGGSASTTFNNLTINKASGTLTINLDQTVNGTLTLTSGNIDTGSTTLIINTAGAVSRTSGHIIGNLQKKYATSAGAVVRTYEIGTSTNYTPVVLTLWRITTAGNVTATVTDGDHPNLSTSGINTARSVNRYWTLTPAGGLAWPSNDVAVTFVDSDKDAGATAANFAMRKYNLSAWSSPPGGSTAAANVTTGKWFTTLGDFVCGEIAPGTTTTFVGSSANPSVFGQSVTFTASISNGGAPVAEGTITFKEGAATLSGPITVDANGQATLVTNGLSVAAHTITAIYTGTSNFTGSTNSVVQTVNKASTTSTVGSSSNPSVFGQPVILTATIAAAAPGAGTPSGTVIFKDGGVALSTNTLNGSGQAAITNSSFSVATHLITVEYGGSANFNASTSSVLNQVVHKGNTTNVVSSSANPSVSGQSVTLTATVSAVSPAAGTPGGTVIFKDGAVSLSTNTLNGSGQATFVTNGFSIGTHSITVEYGGNASFLSSTSSVLSQVVNKAATTTSLTSAPNPSVYGQSVIFTATVSVSAPGTGVISGTVILKDGGVGLATNTVDASGVTAFTNAALSGGTHSMTAEYSGNGTLNGSTSAAYSHVVSRVTTTTVSSSVNPSVYGQNVVFTVTVSSGGGATPTGVAFLYDDGSLIGVGLFSGGVATFNIDYLDVLTHPITADYGGDSNFDPSSSSILTQVVNKASTSTALASSKNPTIIGEAVILTATVSVTAPGGGSVTGTVEFRDGTNTIGTADLDGAGQAAITNSAFSLGNHLLTVVYPGDPSYNGSTSAVTTQTVTKANTTTALGSSVNPTVSGQSVTFTATVSVVAPGSGTPTGSVIFKDNGVDVITNTLNGAAQATWVVSSLAVGGHPVTAEYLGDSGFNGSASTVLTQTVNKAGTTLSISSDNPDPSVVGQSVTVNYSVSVTAPGAGTPSGNVVVSDGTDSATNSVGAGSCVLTPTTAGAKTLTVTYVGDGSFNASTNTTAHTVNPASTATALGSSANPATYGNAVVFTATVTAQAPGGGTPDGSVQFLDGATPLGTVTLSGGIAALTNSSLAAGSHPITASYAGDSNYLASSSTTVTQTITKANTTTTVALNDNPSKFGQTVSFTATVSGGGGTPTGTVTFKDGGATLGTVALDGSGQATFSTNSLSVGSHGITAEYPGDSNFNGSNSSAQPQTVEPSDTATVVSSSVNPSVFGQAVILSATVSAVAPGAGTPAGTVEFWNGTNSLGTSALSSGTASLTNSSLAVASHPITAVFGGSASFTNSTSAVFTQTVNKASSTAAVTASADPTTYGSPVIFTATISAVAPGGGTPSGTVEFFDGANSLGTNTLSGGVTAITNSTLGAGSHSIRVVYSDSASHLGSISPNLSHTVNKANTSTALLSDNNPSGLGENVTFTATVSSGSGIPTGLVTFRDGTNTIASAALNGSGQAALTTAGLAGGTHPITAEYVGDGNFNGSTSSVLTQTVTKANTTATVSSGTNPSVYGQSVTFTATVTSIIGTPQGTVTFKAGTNELGSATLNGLGQATLNVSSLVAGSHSITVEYAGSLDHNPSTSSVLTQTVNKTDTASGVSSSASISVFGQAVVYTATVTAQAPGAGTATGTVTFKANSNTIGSATLNGSGQALLTNSSLNVGSHTITAEYGGDSNFNASASSGISQLVNAANTVSTVSTTNNPSSYGQSLVITATVTAQAPGAGTPDGDVEFFDGAISLGLATLTNATTVVTNSSFAAGNHSLRVIYNGSSNFNVSISVAYTQVVNKASTTTSLGSSLNPSTFGDSVTFTATVTSGVGTPTGTVSFYEDGNLVGTSSLNGSGQATFSISSLSGDHVHSLTATYNGDSNFATSTSSPLLQTVNRATTTTTLASGTNPSTFGQSVTFTATVTGNGGTPTGTVTFRNGTNTIGATSLNGSGQAVFGTAGLAAGTHSITAQYGSDGNYLGSTSTALTQTVDKAASTVGLASSANPSVFGQSVTFTATVTGPGNTPTGTVTFKNGTNTLGSAALNGSGQATLNIASLVVATHSITAEYAGDGNYNPGNSSVLNQTVNKASTASAVVSSINPSAWKQSVTFTATVTASAPGAGLPTGSVTFKDGTNTLGTATLNGSGQATLATSTLTVGGHSITVEFGGDGSFNGSTSSTLTQTVNNTAPVANTDSYSVNEDTTLNVTAPGVLGNDTDTEGNPLTAVKVSDPSNGTVTLNSDGSFSYSPATNYNGSDSFTYRANDGATDGNITTVSITINAVNDPPTPVNDSASVVEDSGANTISVLVNDSSAPDGSETLTVVAVTQPANGSTAVTGGGTTVSYTPSTNFFGTNTFSYTISDGNGGTNSASATVIVTPVNDAPTGTDDDFTTNEDTPLNVAAPGVLGNDGDVDGDALTALVVTNPAHGTLTLNANGAVLYTPALNYSGSDSFTYRASDGALTSDVTTVTITINAVNDPPTALDGFYSLNEDTALIVPAPGVLINDSDVEGSPISATLVSGVSHGTLIFSTNGAFAYTPTNNFFGLDTFTYRANDGLLDSSLAVVNLTVQPVDDPPTAVNDAYGTTEDTPLNVSAPGVQANDGDVDGDTVMSSVLIGPAHGTLTLNANGSFVYTPFANYNGTDSFTYENTDGDTLSAVATVTITISPVNDPPIANSNRQSFNTAEDATLVVTAPGILENDSDPDGDPLTAVLVSTTTNGTLNFNANGSFTYTPVTNFTGVDTFTYRATDSTNFSGVATVQISVNAVNDPPVATAESYPVSEDTLLSVAAPGVLGNDTDVDNPVITALLVQGASNGVVSLSSDGSFTYTPSSNYFGPDSFRYQATDGTDDSAIVTVNLTVNAVNDPPIARNNNYTLNEDTALVVAAPGLMENDSDVEGSAIAAVLVSAPTNGTLSLNSNGSFTYTPSTNFHGSDSFTYRDTDGTTNGNVAIVAITVVSVNDAPVANGNSYSVVENTFLTIAAPGVLANDGDVDGDTLTVRVVEPPLHGALTLNANGAFTYTPDFNYYGTDEFTYQSNDGTADSDVATIHINVNPFTLDTLTVLGSSPNPSQCEQPVTFTATVFANESVITNGTVTFREGGTVLASNVALNASGQAVFVTAALAPGNRVITADYDGTVNYTVSSATITQTVTQTSSSLALATGNNPSLHGAALTLTASVTPSHATGTVEFFDGATSLGMATVNAGVATLTTTTLALSNHTLTATYSGDSCFSGSTAAPISQQVDPSMKAHVYWSAGSLINGLVSNTPVAGAEFRLFVSKALCNGVAISTKPLFLNNVFENCPMVTYSNYQCKGITDASGHAVVVVPVPPVGVKIKYALIGKTQAFDDVTTPGNPDAILAAVLPKKFIIGTNGLETTVFVKKSSRADGSKVVPANLRKLP